MKFALACLLLVACDTKDNQMGPMPDAPPGTPACTGAIFDWCATGADCMSNNCHFFEMNNFTVCTQTCSASAPCPADKSGNPATCNNRGICKPAEPNTCAL